MSNMGRVTLVNLDVTRIPGTLHESRIEVFSPEGELLGIGLLLSSIDRPLDVVVQSRGNQAAKGYYPVVFREQ